MPTRWRPRRRRLPCGAGAGRAALERAAAERLDRLDACRLQRRGHRRERSGHEAEGGGLQDGGQGERRAGDACRIVPSATFPVGLVPFATTSGCQSERHVLLVQMNRPFRSALRL